MHEKFYQNGKFGYDIAGVFRVMPPFLVGVNSAPLKLATNVKDANARQSQELQVGDARKTRKKKKIKIVSLSFFSPGSKIILTLICFYFRLSEIICKHCLKIRVAAKVQCQKV